MAYTNKNWVSMSDKAIISTIGGYVKYQRLLKNKIQAEIAEAAGVNRFMVSQLKKKGCFIDLLTVNSEGS